MSVFFFYYFHFVSAFEAFEAVKMLQSSTLLSVGNFCKYKIKYSRYFTEFYTATSF